MSAPARAEVLTVSGVYAGGSDAAAEVHSIAVERFGGVDGTTLSLRIEDMLRDVVIHGANWFSVMPAMPGTDADALLRGSASADVREERTRQTRNRCVARDENGKCTENKDIEVNCTSRTVILEYSVRLTGFDGRSYYMGDGQPQQQVTYCPEDTGVKTVESTVRELAEQAARDTRHALAPRNERRDIRVMETRKGLSGDVSKAFAAAVKLTKTDQQAACDKWAEIAVSAPSHLSTVFNLGLCAEMRGQLDVAESYYRHALELSPRHDYPSSGLSRVHSRNRALWQMEVHGGVE